VPSGSIQQGAAIRSVLALTKVATSPVSPTGLASLRSARFEDYEAIAALHTRNGLRVETQEEWLHLYANNPLYIGDRRSWPIGWVLETRRGEVVGYLGNIVCKYELGGNTLTVLTGRGWVVDRPYRVQSISLLNELLRQKHVDLYLFTTPNPTTSRIFELLRLPRVPTGEWDKSAFWITNYRGFGASLRALKFPALPKLAAVAAGAAFYIADKTNHRVTVSRHQLPIELCSGFDERFDEFWHKLKTGRRNVLLALRTRDTLNWHFKFALANGKLWIAAIIRNKTIVAYAVFLRQDVPRFGLKRVRLIDFQSIDSKEQLCISLLHWALQRCRREGIHMLEWVGLSSESAIATQLAPHFRTLPFWTYFYSPANKAFAQTLSSADTWDPTLLDGDASL
jgi:hypothetical protein